jgi:phage terminase Nu1 subunit (DNA packaging protein)
MTDVNASVLTSLFDLSERRLRDLATAGVVVSTGRGTYALEGSITAYVRHLREQAAGRLGDGGELDPVRENAAHKRSMRELNEIKKAELEGRS